MIETNNPGHGFFGTYALKKGEEAARKAWAVATSLRFNAKPPAGAFED